jgi:hypothetical protein
MTKINDDEMLVDDFDLTLDSFGSFNELLGDKKEDTIITDFVDYEITKPSKKCYKTFNEKYKEYKKLQDILTPTKPQREQMVILGEEMAILVADEFDFNDSEVSGLKKEYIEFARERLVAGTRKPYFRVMSMLYYIKALYGKTNVAFNLEGTNRKVNLLLGHDYVTRLERYTNVHALKAYVLSLRAYKYISDGDVLDMSNEKRLKTIETDLIYATKWDEKNYLALYALGLVYLNTSSEKYDVNKAINLFERVTALKGKTVELDSYLEESEKTRIIALAEKKLSSLK